MTWSYSSPPIRICDDFYQYSKLYGTRKMYVDWTKNYILRKKLNLSKKSESHEKQIFVTELTISSINTLGHRHHHQPRKQSIFKLESSLGTITGVCTWLSSLNVDHCKCHVMNRYWYGCRTIIINVNTCDWFFVWNIISSRLDGIYRL